MTCHSEEAHGLRRGKAGKLLDTESTGDVKTGQNPP